MPRWIAQDTSNLSDEAYQDYSLQGVSRTFALTIPQLPEQLRLQVGNAYLLCRITDTIEDESSLSMEQKEAFANQFVNVIKGNHSPEQFAKSFFDALTEKTPQAERDLVQNTARVIRLTHGFNQNQRQAIERCVEEMATGMIRFQKQQSLNGLRDTNELDEYCYYVAGVVGVMLTELFCDYSQQIAQHRERMLKLAVSFGQGLQMTNILKDIWEDQKRGACWLPNDVFAACDFPVRNIIEHRDDACYLEGLEQLIAIASMHLRNALEYTMLIPASEKGMRRFCFWALGMAILTLRKINKHKNFKSGLEVKISRRSVKATVAATELVLSSDKRAQWLYDQMSRGLPRVSQDTKAVVIDAASHKP